MWKNSCEVISLVTQNNVELLYEEKKDSEFNAIEFWFRFGSSSDPKSKVGLVHLIEHLLIPEELIKEDIFARYNTYATTSKERIRVRLLVKKEKTIRILKVFLQHFRSFKTSTYNFEYQKRKVIEEIKFIKKAAVVRYLEKVEGEIFNGEKYGQLTVGVKEDVEKLEYIDVKRLFEGMFERNGLIVSVAGDVQIDEVRDVIESTLPLMRLPDNIQSSQVFKFDDMLIRSKSSGILCLHNTINDLTDRNTNYILDELLLEYLKFTLNELPVSIKHINYKKYKLMALYFPKIPSVLKRYETFYSSSRVQQYDFLSVRDLLIEQKLFRINRVQGCAEDNAFAAFMGLPLKRHDIVQSLEKIDYKIFKQHFDTVINTNNRSIISSIE